MRSFTNTPRRASVVATCAGLLGLIGTLGTGCADADGAAPIDEDEPRVLAAFADVSIVASGNGCPEGKWRSEGELAKGNLRISFDAFRGAASRSTKTASAGCNLILRASPLSTTTAYSLTGFTVVGDATLPQGVSAQVSMSASNVGGGGSDDQNRHWQRLDGVHNNTFITKDYNGFPLACGKQVYPVQLRLRDTVTSDGSASGSYTIKEVKDFKVKATTCSP